MTSRPPSRFPAAEVTVTRQLADRVAEIAASPRMRAVRQRWRDVNELARPDRAPVWCKPVGCWEELLPEAGLACADPFLRDIERELRRVLVKEAIGDDSIVNPWFDVPRCFDVEPPNRWGVDIGRHASGAAGGAWGFDPPLKSAADLPRLKSPRFRHDAGRTAERLAASAEALGETLPVRPRTGGAFGLLLSATIGKPVAELLGLGEMMMHMATEPELVHRVTRLVTDAVAESNRFLAGQGLLDRNNDEPMTFSDDFGPAPGPGGRLSPANLWCAANSQEYDQVSPAMWRQFCLAYQQPLLAGFGRVIYGCCENLTHKLDDVLRLPNLRVLVCSAWTDMDTLLAKTGPEIVIMWRQKASDVVLPDTLKTIARDLDEGARKLRGRPCQVVLRELQTLAGHPDRLSEWTRLAIAAAERHA